MGPDRAPESEPETAATGRTYGLSSPAADHKFCKSGSRRGGVAMYDMKNLDRLKTIEENAADAMQAFWAFDKAALADGTIPVKYKELMACAVAFTTQCPYCIEIHSKQARKAGASDQELAEVVLVAAALRAGAAVTHGTHAFPDRR